MYGDLSQTAALDHIRMFHGLDGSSLADKAWGRESAVYRITGVMTVVAGWFVTGFGALIIAFTVAIALMYGGNVAIIVISMLCGYMLLQSNIKKNRQAQSRKQQTGHKEVSDSNIVRSCVEEVCEVMEKVTRIYDRTLLAVFKENRKVLREMVRESNDLFYQSRERKYAVLPTIQKLQDSDMDTSHYYVQVVDYMSEVTKALVHITRPCFDHIDNNHEGFTKEQVEEPDENQRQGGKHILAHQQHAAIERLLGNRPRSGNARQTVRIHCRSNQKPDKTHQEPRIEHESLHALSDNT